MKPKISIIVPVYNVEKYLDRCMNSIINQTMNEIEIILVDDKSPDNCPRLCDEYAKQDSRIKVIHKNKNEGLGYARNTGLDIATGEYIAFVDSDDFVTVDLCEKLYLTAKHNDADVVYGGVYYYYDEKKIKTRKNFKKIQRWSNEEVKELLLDFIATKPTEKNDTLIEVSVWKALFRKSLLDDNKIRFVSERDFISEDIIFDIDYLHLCRRVTIIPDPVYYYCNNESSLSKSYRKDRFIKVNVLYEEIKRRLSNIYKENDVNLRCDRFLIARARTNARAIAKNQKLIGKSEVINGLRDICENDNLKKVLSRYPIHLLPKKYYIVALLMKHKKYNILRMLLSR